MAQIQIWDDTSDFSKDVLLDSGWYIIYDEHFDKHYPNEPGYFLTTVKKLKGPNGVSRRIGLVLSRSDLEYMLDDIYDREYKDSFNRPTFSREDVRS